MSRANHTSPSRLQRLRCCAALMVAATLVASCAKQGFPSGGPRDTEPPQMQSCTPKNESRMFDAKQFYIAFDEYVVLKDADNNVLVSPPMATKPQFTTKGKGVLVKLPDSLQTNATYLFQFKEAIADFTEGNVLPSFEYVFSTGSEMDTMMMAGQVLSARNDKAWADVTTVMAYSEQRFVADSCDTIATWGQPDYVTRCDKEGNFSFHYIPSGNYRLVAVADKNRNLRVDRDEAVAWDNSLVASVDSIDSSRTMVMHISAPDSRVQRVQKAEFVGKNHAMIVSTLPMAQPTIEGDSVVWQLRANGDTIDLWTATQTVDSMRVVLSDSTGLDDTLRMRYRPPRGAGRGSRQNTASAASEQPLMRSLCTGSTAYYDELWIEFSTPVRALYDSCTAEVMKMSDSTLILCNIELDSSHLKARLDARLNSGEQYRIRIADSLYADIYGRRNDSLSFALTPKDYGTLTLQVENLTGGQLLIEVLDGKDTIVARKIVDERMAKIQFMHLATGEYRLRAVIDADQNGAWTPGDYRHGRQPESYLMFDKQLQLREKWEMEERWTVSVKERKTIMMSTDREMPLKQPPITTP